MAIFNLFQRENHVGNYHVQPKDSKYPMISSKVVSESDLRKAGLACDGTVIKSPIYSLEKDIVKQSVWTVKWNTT